MATSVNHTRSFEIEQPIARVFPLFSPEGENAWVPGWSYQNVMGTTQLSEDYIFLTSSHDHADSDAIWLVKRYEPAVHHVQFYKIEPGEKVGVVAVTCTELGGSRTGVEVTYKYTALSAEAEAFVSAFDEAAYHQFIAEWESLLNEYFAKQ